MTIWMAVDAAGLVGFFDRRSAGGMPDGAVALGEIDTFALDALRFARAIGASHAKIEPSPGPKTGRVIIVVGSARIEAPSSYRDAAPHPRLEETLGAWVVREASPRILGTLEPLDPSGLAMLQSDPSVLAVLDEAEIHAWLARATGDTGIYRWWCPGDDSDAYVRAAGPADPIRARELPMELRHAIERTRIRTTFATQRGVSLRRSAGPKRRGKTHPRVRSREDRSKEDRAWDALVARSRNRPPPLALQAFSYVLVGGLALSIGLIVVWTLIGIWNG